MRVNFGKDSYVETNEAGRTYYGEAAHNLMHHYNKLIRKHGIDDTDIVFKTFFEICEKIYNEEVAKLLNQKEVA